MNYQANTYIKCLYSSGFSYIMMSYYRTNLVFTFRPYSGKNYNGLDQYDKNIFLSTSIDYDASATLYALSTAIISVKDAEKKVTAVLTCSNNTTLTFEYMPDQNNQWYAYLTINKNNQTIPFRFKTYTYQVQIDGQLVTRVIQSGLGIFAEVLKSYFSATGINNHLNKFTDEERENMQSPSQIGINVQY